MVFHVLLRLSASPASPRTGKLSAQLIDEVAFAFPPQGEGGPLAVDEVSERSEAFFIPSGKKDLIRPSVRTGAPSPCVGKAFCRFSHSSNHLYVRLMARKKGFSLGQSIP